MSDELKAADGSIVGPGAWWWKRGDDDPQVGNFCKYSIEAYKSYGKTDFLCPIPSPEDLATIREILSAAVKDADPLHVDCDCIICAVHQALSLLQKGGE